MFSRFQGMLTVLGRVMLSAIFLMSAVGNDIPNFDSVARMMQSAGIPSPQLMLAGAIVFLIAGGISVMLGFKARFGAALLLIFLALATYYFHAFWKVEGQEQQMQMVQFLKNLSIGGGLLFIMANGPGPMSFDARTSNRPLQSI